MNSDLVKWLIHQPALVVAAFCLGATLCKTHPDWFTGDLLTYLLISITGLGGGAMSWQQLDPHVPQPKPEGEKS